jgi:hypothetical protein
MSSKKYDLLLEIVKLVKKYGYETFEDLSKELSSELFKEKIPIMLKEISLLTKEPAIKKSRTKKEGSASGSFRSQLEKYQVENPQMAYILSNLYDDLLEKKYLPTLASVKNFALDNGLKPLKAKSRRNGIIPLLKQLMELDQNYIKKVLKSIGDYSEKDDRSLAGWSDIILKKDQRLYENNDHIEKNDKDK